MRAIGSILLGLVRPGKGLEKAGDAAKWLWVPLAVVLLATVLLKTSVASPMKMEAQRAQADTMIQKQMDTMPEADRKEYEKAVAEAEASGDISQDKALDAAMGIGAVADIVFGVLGAAVALLYIATFFFVAAKTWANPVKYTTMLTIAGLTLLPHALRNILQATYMAGSGMWLQHAGLGALVAPAGPDVAPGVGYALLQQVDIFVLWGLALLLGALLSNTVGLEKKRAISALAVFVVVTAILQALPTIVTGLFMGGGGVI
jgi:ElaB/YqjD/DUF883 family membrane-anchored ribosome-binding protein